MDSIGPVPVSSGCFKLLYSKVGPDHLVDAVPGKPWSLADVFACLGEYEVPVLASLQLSTGTTYSPVGGRPWSIRCYILCFFPKARWYSVSPVGGLPVGLPSRTPARHLETAHFS